MKTVEQLGAFILAHYPRYRKWDRDIFNRWLQWNISQGFVQCVIGDGEELVGLTVCRPIMRKDWMGDEFYNFDPEGDTVYVDLAIALKPFVIQGLVFAGLKRFGMRPFIAWKRAPYFVVNFHDAHKFRRIIFGRALTQQIKIGGY
jgi:hypothetical protein